MWSLPFAHLKWFGNDLCCADAVITYDVIKEQVWTGMMKCNLTSQSMPRSFFCPSLLNVKYRTHLVWCHDKSLHIFKCQGSNNTALTLINTTYNSFPKGKLNPASTFTHVPVAFVYQQTHSLRNAYIDCLTSYLCFVTRHNRCLTEMKLSHIA